MLKLNSNNNYRATKNPFTRSLHTHENIINIKSSNQRSKSKQENRISSFNNSYDPSTSQLTRATHRHDSYMIRARGQQNLITITESLFSFPFPFPFHSIISFHLFS